MKDSFTFDRVFDMESRQQEVFDYSIKSTVDDILNGYNGTVFAYGQVGLAPKWPHFDLTPCRLVPVNRLP